MDVKSRNCEKFEIFFELFGPPCRNALADLGGSIPECAQVCAVHIGLHLASLRKIEMVSVLCTNETTPQFFEFLTPPPHTPRGRLSAQGGTSADIVPTQIIFGVDPCKRCWDIAQKPPKCKNAPLTPIVTKISFAPFSARRGPPTPNRGEYTSRPRLRPHATFGVNRPAGCWEIVDRTKCKNYHWLPSPFSARRRIHLELQQLNFRDSPQ